MIICIIILLCHCNCIIIIAIQRGNEGNFSQVHWRYFGSCSDHGAIIMITTASLPPPPSALCSVHQQHQHHDFVISSSLSLHLQKLMKIQIHPSHHPPVHCAEQHQYQHHALLACFPIRGERIIRYSNSIRIVETE